MAGNLAELKEIISKKLDSFMMDDLVKIEKHITDNWQIG
jgi:hypothetical protein